MKSYYITMKKKKHCTDCGCTGMHLSGCPSTPEIVINPKCDICGKKLVEDDGDNTTCGRCNQRFNPELKKKVKEFLGEEVK